MCSRGRRTLPDALTIVQDVNVHGTTFETSTVEVTTTITNNAGAPVALGLRYLWDTQIGIDDVVATGVFCHSCDALAE